MAQVDGTFARGHLSSHLLDKGMKAFARHRAPDIIAIGQWRVDRQFVADEQRQRFEQDMPVAFDPTECQADAIEAPTEAFIQFMNAAPVKPGRDGVLDDGGLGDAGTCRKGI